MQSIFIQFQVPRHQSGIIQETSFTRVTKKIISSVLGKIIPAANPDFDNKIDEVKTWLVECDSENGIPQREVGLEENGMTIVKMPFKRLFKVQLITHEIFEKKWILLE
jgi:hypothetical protein